MCGMKILQVFDISDNHISGDIPSCLNNITFWKKSSPNSTDSNYYTRQLYDLIMFGYFRSELKISLQIKYHAYTFQGIPLLLMTIVDMSSNQFTGSIPS